MSAISTTRAGRWEWRVAAPLVALSLVPAIAGGARLVELAGGAAATEADARFFATPLPVVLHILSAIPYSILGAFQLLPSLRRRRPRWHKRAGRFLVVLGLTAALTGLWMAHFYPWPEGDGRLLYLLRLLFGTGMVASLVLAVAAVRRRDFTAHGAWMIRAYAIGLGAGTQVLTHLPYFVFVGGRPPEVARAVLMGAGWVINVVVAEWVIRRGRFGARPPSPVFVSAAVGGAT